MASVSRLLDGAGGVDVGAFASLLGSCLAFGDRLFGSDAGFFLGAFGGLLLLRGFGAGRRGFVGDVAFLVEFGFALGPLDGQRLLAGLEILLGDRDFGVAHDLVALLLARLGDAGQRRKALRVEEVVGVEMLDVGLVEASSATRIRVRGRSTADRRRPLPARP